MAASSESRQLTEATVPTDVISLDAAYAIVSEMRGVYKNALDASSARNQELKVTVQVSKK
jgi:HSP20 family molecular chaperone IbpA